MPRTLSKRIRKEFLFEIFNIFIQNAKQDTQPILVKSAFEKYKGRGTKYKLKVPRASGSPEYAEAEPKGNFQLYIVICPLYIPTNSDLTIVSPCPS